MTSDFMSVKMYSPFLSRPCSLFFCIGICTGEKQQLSSGQGREGTPGKKWDRGEVICTAALVGAQNCMWVSHVLVVERCQAEVWEETSTNPPCKLSAEAPQGFIDTTRHNKSVPCKEMVQCESEVLGYSNSNIPGWKLTSLPSGWLRCAES